MARWVDMRLPGGSASDAIFALVSCHGPVTFRLDLNPAAGPEVELSVQDVPEQAVCATLASAGIRVLASRLRLGPQLADDLWRRR